MENDNEIVESLIAGGLIGAALGALLSKNKGDGSALAAIAGAALLATFKANEQAKKTNIPLYTEEDGNLYELQPGGSKKFIKTIEKSNIRLLESFNLK